MRLQATALLVAVLAIPPAAYAVDPESSGGAAIPPSGGAAAPAPTAPDPAVPDPAEPTAPPLVPLDAAHEPVREAKLSGSPPPSARSAQEDDSYAEVQVPKPEAAPRDAGAATIGGSGLAETGLQLSLLLAAGLSTLGAGLLVLGLLRRPR